MSNINKLHFVLLVPSDKINNTEAALAQAALHMQCWCRWQMGNNKTFTWDLHSYQTSHDSQWYREYAGDPNNPTPHAERYWANAQTDARDYAGARFYMEHDSWVVYVDATIGADQHAGGASVNGSGLCVLHGKDCASIRGQDPEWTLCRGVGGGLHEALHTLGVPHPSPPPNPDWTRGVMGIGYMSYPNAILTDNDKWTLDHHRFFEVEPKRTKPNICAFNDGSVRPRPNPRPKPVPRPK